jgi:hypothetical protein
MYIVPVLTLEREHHCIGFRRQASPSGIITVDHSVQGLANPNGKRITFTIIISADSIKDEVNRFLSGGQITIDDAKSLLQNLEAAGAERAKRQLPCGSEYLQCIHC